VRGVVGGVLEVRASIKKEGEGEGGGGGGGEGGGGDWGEGKRGGVEMKGGCEDWVW